MYYQKYITVSLHQLPQAVSDQRSFHFVVIYFLLLSNNLIDTERGRNQVYLLVKLSKLGQGKLHRGRNVLFPFACILCYKFIMPLFVYSKVMSYKVLPVLFFMLVIYPYLCG